MPFKCVKFPAGAADGFSSDGIMLPLKTVRCGKTGLNAGKSNHVASQAFSITQRRKVNSRH